MLHVLLVVIYWTVVNIPCVVLASSCDPSKFLCFGLCPPRPRGLDIQSGSICMKDIESDACVCWLDNPSEKIRSLFQCDAWINNSVSILHCKPPLDCFSPDSNGAGCLILTHCPCLLLEESDIYDSSWKRVKGYVYSKRNLADITTDANSVEKVQGDFRDFSLKHLLFLLGFVIAPLLCWCVLNFFHEGKCRKKPPQPPEAQPIPTSRSFTVDNMNNEEQPSCSSSFPSATAPSNLDLESVITPEAQEALLKNESPPPYSKSEHSPVDLGPPPTYEDAMRGTDVTMQQMWQTVFILPSDTQEDV